MDRYFLFLDYFYTLFSPPPPLPFLRRINYPTQDVSRHQFPHEYFSPTFSPQLFFQTFLPNFSSKLFFQTFLSNFSSQLFFRTFIQTPFSHHHSPITTFPSSYYHHRIPITIFPSPYSHHHIPISIFPSPFVPSPFPHPHLFLL